ncbi:MAG TPA: Dabb family protein [Acidimicrobiales bacterium]|nr:Dabb family protein [Acidimicrobiales bacterium]
MLTHVALFTFKPGTTDEQVTELSAGLATLPGLIPEIKGYRFGADAGLAEGNVDFGVVAEFHSAEGYRAYANHPAHRDVIDRLVKPIRQQRTGIQFEG